MGSAVDTIKNRTIEVLKSLATFDKYMIEESAKQNSMIETIKTLKSGSSELAFKDVQPILAEINERHYTLFLIDKDARASIESLTELLKLCKTLEINLELDEEDQKILDSILENNQPIYGIVDNKVSVIDQQKLDTTFAAIKSKNDSENGLEKLFNSDLFK